MSLIVNQINYGLIMEKNFTIYDILIYSTYNKAKSVIAKRFIKTKFKIYFKKWQLMIATLILVI